MNIVRSVSGDFDDRFGEGLGYFLRQVVAGALDDPVRPFARELAGMAVPSKMSPSMSKEQKKQTQMEFRSQSV